MRNMARVNGFEARRGVLGGGLGKRPYLSVGAAYYLYYRGWIREGCVDLFVCEG